MRKKAESYVGDKQSIIDCPHTASLEHIASTENSKHVPEQNYQSFALDVCKIHASQYRLEEYIILGAMLHLLRM